MNAPSIEGFQSAADQFCSLAKDELSLNKEDLWRIRELLIRLIFHIPAVESHPQSADFDPHDFEAKDEPVIIMLADDLIAILIKDFR